MIAVLDVFPAVVDLLVRLQCVLAETTRTVTLEGAPDDGHNSARNMLSRVYATKQ
jgi:hypothetical protein